MFHHTCQDDLFPPDILLATILIPSHHNLCSITSIPLLFCLIVSNVPDQNGIFQLYNMLEIYHSSRELSNCVPFHHTATHTMTYHTSALFTHPFLSHHVSRLSHKTPSYHAIYPVQLQHTSCSIKSHRLYSRITHTFLSHCTVLSQHTVCSNTIHPVPSCHTSYSISPHILFHHTIHPVWTHHPSCSANLLDGRPAVPSQDKSSAIRSHPVPWHPQQYSVLVSPTPLYVAD